MKKEKRKTNVQIVTDLMEVSRYGALSQMFVIDALTKWSAKVAASKPSDYPADGLVDGRAWIGVAKEIQDRLNEAYSR